VDRCRNTAEQRISLQIEFLFSIFV